MRVLVAVFVFSSDIVNSGDNKCGDLMSREGVLSLLSRVKMFSRVVSVG